MTQPTDRFAFGQNWQSYLKNAGDLHVERAKRALLEFHERHDLKGWAVLDVGCGSGIHSYAAVALGASQVFSFDYDADSVEACRRLKARKAPEAGHWHIQQGDILAEGFTQQLSRYDLVYAWGVLHHTGHLWKAVENAARLVKDGGFLHLAIYNRHWTSPFWKAIKKFYCGSPRWIQNLMLAAYAGKDILRLLLKERQNPWRVIRDYPQSRGMLWWNDLRDWLGGYPYEYASVAETTGFLGKLGLRLIRCSPNCETGCSSYLFQRPH